MKQLGNGNDSRDWSGDNFVDFGKILVKNFGLLCIEKRFKKKYFYPRDLLTHTGERERELVCLLPVSLGGSVQSH